MSNKSITLLLIIFCTILGNLIYYNLNKQPTVDPVLTTDKPIDPVPEKNLKISTAQLASIESYNEITERPLFSVDRQEATEEATIEPAPLHRPARDPNLQLMGIVLSDEGQIALLKSRKDPKVKRVKLNEKVENWTLIELQNNSVKLASGKQEIVLEMNRKADPSKRMHPNNFKPPNQNNQPPGMHNPVPPGENTLAPGSPVQDIEEFEEIDDEDEEDDEDLN